MVKQHLLILDGLCGWITKVHYRRTMKDMVITHSNKRHNIERIITIQPDQISQLKDFINKLPSDL